MNQKEIAEATGPQLVAAYNQITGKSIKRFASLTEARKRVAEAVAEKPAAEVRTVSKMASKAGRPHTLLEFKATNSGTTKPHSTSLRGQVLSHIQQSEGYVSLADLTTQFGPKAKGCIQKLIELKHLEVKPQATA